MKSAVSLKGWPDTPAEAIALQNVLRGRVVLRDDFGAPETIAGVDASYDPKTNLTRAVAVLMEFGTFGILDTAVVETPTLFPYIPGLLSFREIPALLECLDKLKNRPGMLMADGQGVAHPRRLGIAAHLGVITGIPAIGAAKSRLTGAYKEPGPRKGDASPLTDKGERIGAVLRSRDNVRPLFVSPGHRVSHETAVALTLQCLTRYRLPEPTRVADKLSKSR